MKKIILALLIVIGMCGFAAFIYPAAFVALTVSTQGYDNQENHAYGKLPRQRYDIYIPDNVKPDAPLLVFFYGGGWSMGDKALYRFVGQTFASRGLIVAIPNYRVYPEAVFPIFMEDAAAAVKRIDVDVKKKFGERHRLFLTGHSAGAHIAMLLALDKHYLKTQDFDAHEITGVIGLSGPYDFLPLTEDKYKKIFPETLRAASQPINFVGKNTPPMLLMTGLADDTVKPGNTERLAEKIRLKGGKVDTRFYENGGHLTTILALYERLPFGNYRVRQDMLDFIATHAK